jgi:hypothetical protein
VNTQSKARPGRSRLARSTATVLAAAGLATVSLVATSGMAQAAGVAPSTTVVSAVGADLGPLAHPDLLWWPPSSVAISHV